MVTADLFQPDLDLVIGGSVDAFNQKWGVELHWTLLELIDTGFESTELIAPVNEVHVLGARREC